MPTDTFFRLPESKRETLLRCARQEFARVPYPDASINRIIHSAGIPRGSFYMYFEDKSDLFLYLMDRFVDAFTEAVCRQLEGAEGDLFLAFRRLFDHLRDRCSSCREGQAAEVITILRRNAGMPHTVAMGQSYGRRFLSRIIPLLDRSALAKLRSGSRVNLERAMAADGRFGGHIVSGHIDGTGTITARRRDDNAVWYTVAASPSLLRYIVEKGSIAMDGISLTVAGVTERDFSVSVIPHTAAVTILGGKGPGDVVNLETDIIGKYVEKLLRPRDAEVAPERGLTLEFLAQNGF